MTRPNNDIYVFQIFSLKKVRYGQSELIFNFTVIFIDAFIFIYHIYSKKRPGALQFTAHKNDVLEQKRWTNLPKFECPKAGLAVILTTFSKHYELVGRGVYLRGGVY